MTGARQSPVARYNTRGYTWAPGAGDPSAAPHRRARQGDGDLDTAHLLNLISTYGYVGFAGLVFIAAVGVPLPLALLLLAMGGLSALPGGPNVVVLMLIGTTAAVAGDTLDYAVGRMGSSLVRNRLLGFLRRLHPRASAVVLDRLWRHQGIAVLLTRSVFTTLSVAVSLFAGASRMRLARFLMWEIPGKGLFVVVTLLAGRLFGSSLVTHGVLPTIVVALAVVAVLALALLEARRWWARRIAEASGPPEGEAPHPI